MFKNIAVHINNDYFNVQIINIIFKSEIKPRLYLIIVVKLQ